jgi:hypothetical protein
MTLRYARTALLRMSGILIKRTAMQKLLLLAALLLVPQVQAMQKTEKTESAKNSCGSTLLKTCFYLWAGYSLVTTPDIAAARPIHNDIGNKPEMLRCNHLFKNQLQDGLMLAKINDLEANFAELPTKYQQEIRSDKRKLEKRAEKRKQCALLMTSYNEEREIQ